MPNLIRPLMVGPNPGAISGSVGNQSIWTAEFTTEGLSGDVDIWVDGVNSYEADGLGTSTNLPTYNAGTDYIEMLQGNSEYFTLDTLAFILNSEVDDAPLATLAMKFDSNPGGSNYLWSWGDSASNAMYIGLRADGAIFQSDGGFIGSDTLGASIVGAHYLVIRFNGSEDTFDAWVDGVQVNTATPMAATGGDAFLFNRVAINALARTVISNNTGYNIRYFAVADSALGDSTIATVNSDLAAL